MLEVRIYGDPVLRKTAEPVKTFDDDLKNIVAEMIESLREEDGVGLAAPQVGAPLRIVVIDTTGGEKEPLVLINPEITESSEEMVTAEEGCLSVPGISLSISRHSQVTVKALDLQGKEFTITNADGLLARALQHEIDHLNGIMIVDHISALQRSMISGKLKKLAKSGRDKSQVA